MKSQCEEERKKFESKEKRPEADREMRVKKIKLDIDDGKQKTLI